MLCQQPEMYHTAMTFLVYDLQQGLARDQPDGHSILNTFNPLLKDCILMVKFKQSNIKIYAQSCQSIPDEDHASSG